MPEEKTLQKEYAYYLKIKPELLKQSSGKFALIKDEKLIGTFDTDSDAYKTGLLQLGNVPFLIVLVADKEEYTGIPILQLGILNAGK